MSKKKNEEFEENENINEDFKGDIHEADDTFGLPDIDFEPLSEKQEESEPPVDETVTYQQEEYIFTEETEVPPSEPQAGSEEENYIHTGPDEDPPYVSGEETPGVDTFEVYHSDTEEPFAPTNTEEEIYAANTDFVEPDQTEHEYIPGSYTPKHKSSNKAGIIIGVILGLLLIGLGVWWFGFEQPARDQVAAQEQQQREADAARRQQEREDQIARENAAKEAEATRLLREADEAANAKPEIGTVETISARTGRYYVVVASAVDGDLAMDYANKLIKSGNNVKIIQPFGKTIFHRVAVKDLGTWADADSAAKSLKPEYGEGVWVIKY